MADEYKLIPKKGSEFEELTDPKDTTFLGFKNVGGLLKSIRISFNNMQKLFGVENAMGSSTTVAPSQKAVSENLLTHLRVAVRHSDNLGVNCYAPEELIGITAQVGRGVVSVEDGRSIKFVNTDKSTGRLAVIMSIAKAKGEKIKFSMEYKTEGVSDGIQIQSGLTILRLSGIYQLGTKFNESPEWQAVTGYFDGGWESGHDAMYFAFTGKTAEQSYEGCTLHIRKLKISLSE